MSQPNPTPPAEVDVAEGRRLLASRVTGAVDVRRCSITAAENKPGRGTEAWSELHVPVIGERSQGQIAHCADDEDADAIAFLLINWRALLTAAEQVAGLRETILSAANICEHWADESRNGGWSTHQVEPNRRLAASLRKAALGAAP